ncbi:MAG: SpoIIE family protein phosphatase [Cyanobacteria bacterium P01_A01_bin.105]
MQPDEPKKLKLLVVDDEPDNLDLLHRTFRRDYLLYKASSGQEALSILETHGEMAIIISDQRMPQMSGTEFLSYTVEKFPNTIRIVLTGYTDVEDLVDAINAGQVFKYITKPWNPKQLKEVVQQAAETYRVVKHRTNTLMAALQRESLFNNMMAAIRGSLDYTSMLQTIVATLGETFKASFAVLHIAEGPPSINVKDGFLTYASADGLSAIDPAISAPLMHTLRDIRLETINCSGEQINRLSAPFIYQQDVLAMIALYQRPTDDKWSKATINLLQSVSEQVALAISQSRLYQWTQRQTEQMRAELEVARQIQSNLLHQSWPHIPGIKIKARCQPARQVGGDFFEVFVHPQGDIWLAVGDVSGKGVPAALFMASAISVLRRELAQENSPMPEQVMHNLNQGLVDDLISNNCFITMALIRYSPTQQRLVYANAGHVYPLVWSHRNLLEASPQIQPTYLDVRGVPLGILPCWQAAAGELNLEAGDVVLLTSDGITEATVDGPNNSTAMLKQEGLWDLLRSQPPELDLDQLLATLHTPDGEQEDDQTLLSLEVG